MFATAHEAAWRTAVAAAVETSGVQPLDARFAVSIDFRTPVPRHRGEMWDIDNLVKPTIDAMAGVFGRREWKGIPQANDDRVDRLSASKRTADDEGDVGASVTVWKIQEPGRSGDQLVAENDGAGISTKEVPDTD